MRPVDVIITTSRERGENERARLNLEPETKIVTTYHQAVGLTPARVFVDHYADAETVAIMSYFRAKGAEVTYL